MDLLFNILLSIHILSAVIGIGATFIFPFVLSLSRSLKDLDFAFAFLSKAVNFPKFGSILLLFSGLGMGAINTDLFQKGWYIAAIILLLIGVLTYVVKVLPALKSVSHTITPSESNEIPEEYRSTKEQIIPFMAFVSIIDIFIVLLMIWKPF